MKTESYYRRHFGIIVILLLISVVTAVWFAVWSGIDLFKFVAGSGNTMQLTNTAWMGLCLLLATVFFVKLVMITGKVKKVRDLERRREIIRNAFEERLDQYVRHRKTGTDGGIL